MIAGPRRATYLDFCSCRTSLRTRTGIDLIGGSEVDGKGYGSQIDEALGLADRVKDTDSARAAPLGPTRRRRRETRPRR
jgi:hypothetical protein